MNKPATFILFAMLWSLSLACADNTANQPSPRNVSTIKDSLKFTSGIRAILQDSEGNYWLGSHSEGLCRFDGVSFTYFTADQGLPDHQVRSIQEDQNGNIWVGTANGVCSFNGATFITHTPNHTSGLGNTNNEHTLWFNAGRKPGVYKTDGHKFQYLEFPIPATKSYGASFEVTSVSNTGKGTAWVATYNALFRFDGKEFQLYDDAKLAPLEEELIHIRSVFEDSKGRVWIGNNGIGVLLLEGNRIIKFSEENGLIHENSNKNADRSPAGTLEHVFAIQEDAEGNIWFGDRDTGIWKYDGTSCTNYKVNDADKPQMPWCIYVNKDREVLVGLANGGVYQLNGSSFERRF